MRLWSARLARKGKKLRKERTAIIRERERESENEIEREREREKEGGA